MQRSYTHRQAKVEGSRTVIIMLLLMLAMTATGLAKIDITNVDAKSEKRKDNASGRMETWVVINYNITDVPAKGTTLSLDALLTSPDGKTLAVSPLPLELLGDDGDITGDGAKSIQWNAEATLVRLGKQGKYKCVMDLKIAGTNGLTRATLNVTSYKSSGWDYFADGTAEISNLKKTGTFSAFCSPVQGQNWQNGVEADAVFYKGDVTSLPPWRGRRNKDVITGAPAGTGCSAFLAIKNQGTPNEKIWVNFARQNNMRLDADGDGNPEKVFQWEFQFRYYGSKKDGSTALSVGNAGEPGQDLWTEWNQGLIYDLKLTTTPDEEEKSNTFDLEVLRHEFKYSYKGAPVMLFTALGDGYFDSDPLLGPNFLTLKSGDMKINDWLSFSGSFSVDTTTDRATFSSVGAWSNGKGDLLWGGDFNGALTTDISTNFAIGARIPKLADKWQIGGFAVTLDSLRFLGGVDKATGIVMDIQLLIDQLNSGCKYDRTKKEITGSEVAGIRLKGVTMSNDGWDISGIEAQNLSMAAAPTFCLKSLKANYNKTTDELSSELIIGCAFFEEIGGSFLLRKSKLENMKVQMKLGTGIPWPQPPPPFHVIEWKGFDAAVSNLVTGPLTLEGNVFFTSNSKWFNAPAFNELKFLIQDIPNIDLSKVNIFELTGGAKLVYDQSLTGSLALKLFRLTENFWVAEGTVSTTLDATKLGIGINGALKFFNFGGTKWLIEGTGAGEISLNSGVNIQAQLHGDIYVPDILTTNAFWAMVNRKIGLPYKLSGVGVTVQNLSTWFDLELPYFGTTGFVVNFTKNPITDTWGFIHPTNGIPKLTSTRKGDDNTILSSGDTTWTGFTVGANAEKVFADVWNSSTAPASVLADPTGKIYTGTVADSSVILYPETHPGMGTLWALKNPRAGAWKLGILGMRSGDSTSIVGIDRQAPAFKVTAATNGREVVARWNGAGASDSSHVALYLDNDQKGFNGIYVGSVNESAGEFHYTMTDSLPECGYYLYAMRVGTGGDGSSIYSDTYLPNPKTSLFPPANLHAVATPAGDVTVTWDQTSEPGVLQHIIRVTDKEGNDSLYAPIDFNYTMATIHVDDWRTKKISIVSRNDANRQGCWSEPVSFVLADVEDRITGGDHSVGIEIHVAPQPVINRTTIFANLTGSAHLNIDLYDIDGRKVMALKEGTFERGTLRADLDASKLPAGIYIVRIVGDGISGSKKISVGK